MKKNKINAVDMQAGNISRDGFMGADRRSLAEIIRTDEEDLKRLNLTHQTIAGRMSYFREAGKKGLGEFIAVAPHFEVACEIVRGLLPCPFGEPGMPACNAMRSIAGRHRKTIIIVRNLRLKKEISFSDLNIHLIAVHGFYEGKGSPFRLEPAELAVIMEIGKDKGQEKTLN